MNYKEDFKGLKKLAYIMTPTVNHAYFYSYRCILAKRGATNTLYFIPQLSYTLIKMSVTRRLWEQVCLEIIIMNKSQLTKHLCMIHNNDRLDSLVLGPLAHN